MKHLPLVPLILLPLLCINQTTQDKIPKNENLHFSLNSSDGYISSEEGNVSYSIGRFYHSSYDAKDNSATEGVQQPLLNYIKTIDKEDDIFKVVAYPNPLANYFIIEASSYTNRSLSYRLTDKNGSLIKVDEIGESGTEVDISGLASAILLFTISARSPNNIYALLEKQFISRAPLESVHSISMPP